MATTAAPRERLPWLFASWTVLALSFLVLAAFAAFYDRFPADERLTHALQGSDVPALGGYFDVVNVLGETWFYIVLIVVVAGAFAAFRAWLEALLVFVAVLSVGLNSVIKDIVRQPRPSPELVHVGQHETDYSFPSGHTVATATLFGLLFFLLPVVVTRRPLRWLFQAGCLLFVVSAGPARVYIGVHWPSDVLGSYLLALLFLMPVVAVYRALRPPPVGPRVAGQAEDRA